MTVASPHLLENGVLPVHNVAGRHGEGVVELRPFVVVGIIGVLCGALNSLLGIGGGAVIVPALVLWAGFQQKEAQAASLWYVIPTSLFSGLLYMSGRGGAHVDIRIDYDAALVAAAFVGALIGAPLVKRIDQQRLRQVFGCGLVVIAAIMIARCWEVALSPNESLRFLILTWIGLTAGFLSSLLGIGGGVIVVPLLVLVAGLDQKIAQGISLLYVVPTALLGAILYHFHVRIQVDSTKVSVMAIAGLAGAYAGYLLMIRTTSAALTVIFAVALALLGVYMVIRARRAHIAAYVPDWSI